MKRMTFSLILFIIFIANASIAQIKVTNGGNVGIGTNNPQQKLHINGNQRIESYASNWDSALSTKVHYQFTCSYHLNYGGRDVFYVCADGWLWTLKGGYFGSDIKLKKDISLIESPLSLIKQLRGVKFKFIDITDYNDLDSFNRDSISSNHSLNIELNAEDRFRFGLVAQEVEQVLPDIVKIMPDSTKAIAYNDLFAIIIEAIKEQQYQLETLQKMVYLQEKELLLLKERVNYNCLDDNTRLKMETSSSINTIDEESNFSAILYDNIPNPFSQKSKIQYFVPENSISAKILIHNMQGKELMSNIIPSVGYGSITINGSELGAGMFLYSLFIDNKIIDTKRMLLTKD